MAPLPTIANVFRVTLNWNPADGVTPRNVMHILAPGSNEADVAQALDDALFDASDAFQPMADAFNLTTMDVIKLDGSSATQTVPVTHELAGGTSGEFVPAVACVIGFHSLTRGPKARGRIFIGPLAEPAIINGTIDTGHLTDMTAAWATVHDDLITAGMALVVASYVHSTAYEVTSIHIDAVCATQRRRQSQLR